MPVTYSDFCTDAQELILAIPTTESKLRNSISRSYYGAYHSALSYANKVNVPPVSDRAGPSHENLRAFYMEDLSSEKDLRMKRRQVGYLLKVLVGNRRKADYDLDKVIQHIDADAHYQRCMKCVGLVEELEAHVRVA